MCVISIVCLTSRPAPRNRRRRRARSHPEQVPGAACSSSRLPSLAARRDTIADRGVAGVDRAGEVGGGGVGFVLRFMGRPGEACAGGLKICRKALLRNARFVCRFEKKAREISDARWTHAPQQNSISIRSPRRCGLAVLRLMTSSILVGSCTLAQGSLPARLRGCDRPS